MQNDYQNNDGFIKDSIFKIGMVVAVDGRKITIKVDKTKNLSHLLYKGQLIKNVSVGNYIKIMKGFTVIIAKIDSERIEENKYYGKTGNNKDINYTNAQDLINRYLIVSLLGFFNGNQFERGIKELPLVYDECFLLDGDEYCQVHNFLKGNELSIDIGALALDTGQNISLSVNNLFASHIGIFGNTGSGKSYTLVKIYNSLFTKLIKHNDQYKSFFDKSKIYLFDFNGEYIDSDDGGSTPIIDEYKQCYRLSTRNPERTKDIVVIEEEASQSQKSTITKFALDVAQLHNFEFWATFLTATEQTQRPFIKRALSKKSYFNILYNNGVGDMFIDTQNFSLKLANIIVEKIKSGIDKDKLLDFINSFKYVFNCNPTVQFFIQGFQNLHYHSKTSKYYFQTGQVKSYEDDSDFLDKIIDVTSKLGVDAKNITDFQKIKLTFYFQYFDEASDRKNIEFIKPLLGRMHKISDLEKVLDLKITQTSINKQNKAIFHVISLKDVNIEMKKTLPLLICKQIYDKHKKEQDTISNRKYLNIIIDEAHNILSYDSSRENEIWKDHRLETFEEIIKEGRKFGVFLTIASQRPSDISHTIISQLHNYFLHRLINNKDIEAVEKTISYLDKVSFDYLPILPTGVCIFAGLSAQVPVILQVGEVEKCFAPLSDTINLTDLWSNKGNENV
jgi:hypothetical protein